MCLTTKINNFAVIGKFFSCEGIFFVFLQFSGTAHGYTPIYYNNCIYSHLWHKYY